MSESVTLADVERLCWHLSGWQVDQRDVDQLLAVVQAYTGGDSSAAAPPLAEGGDHEPPAAPEVLVESEAAEDPAPVLPAPQAAVQRVEVSGTITLECSGACARSRPSRKAVDRPRRVPSPPATADPETSRECRTCGRTQPIDVYPLNTHGLRGRRGTCQTCENKRKRESRRNRRQAAAS